MLEIVQSYTYGLMIGIRAGRENEGKRKWCSTQMQPPLPHFLCGMSIIQSRLVLWLLGLLIADFTPLLSVCLFACLLAMEAWKALKGGRQAVLNRTIIGAVSVHMCLLKHLGVCTPFLNTLTLPSPDESPHSQILFCY